MKKIVKTILKILSYLLLTISLLLFIPPILVWALSQYIEDPKLATNAIKEVIKAVKGGDKQDA